MRKWTKPQLIVLARGTPEERVLDDCKTAITSGLAPALSNYTGCTGQTIPCTDCTDIVSS